MKSLAELIKEGQDLLAEDEREAQELAEQEKRMMKERREAKLALFKQHVPEALHPFVKSLAKENDEYWILIQAPELAPIYVRVQLVEDHSTTDPVLVDVRPKIPRGFPWDEPYMVYQYQAQRDEYGTDGWLPWPVRVAAYADLTRALGHAAQLGDNYAACAAECERRDGEPSEQVAPLPVETVEGQLVRFGAAIAPVLRQVAMADE